MLLYVRLKDEHRCRSTPLRDQRQQSQTMRLSGQGRTIPTLHAWSKGRTDTTLTRRLRSRTKGLFTWKWGTPGRWGNPPSRGRKTKRVYIQSYDPGVLGWGFLRLFISASRKNKPTHGLCSISRLGLLTRRKFKEFLNYFELNEPWTRYTTLLNAYVSGYFFCGGGKDIFAHLAHPPTGWIEACKDSWQRICSVRSEPRSNPKELVFHDKIMCLVEILGKFFFNLFPAKTYCYSIMHCGNF